MIAARIAKELWDPQINYRAAAGQAMDPTIADEAAEFVLNSQKGKLESTMAGPGD